MVMSAQERRTVEALLQDNMQESAHPESAVVVAFYDEQGTMLYAGIIKEWPIFVSNDVEWGQIAEKDATKLPFAGKAIKFFSNWSKAPSEER